MASQFNKNVNRQTSPEQALTALQTEMQKIVEKGESQS
jgi:hypothetical protein